MKFRYVEVLCIYFLTSLVPFHFDKCSLSYWGFISACPNCTAKSKSPPKIEIWVDFYQNLCCFKAYWSNFHIQKVSLHLTKGSSSCELTKWINLGCPISVPTKQKGKFKELLGIIENEFGYEIFMECCLMC